jgi:hypothetical protein
MTLTSVLNEKIRTVIQNVLFTISENITIVGSAISKLSLVTTDTEYITNVSQIDSSAGPVITFGNDLPTGDLTCGSIHLGTGEGTASAPIYVVDTNFQWKQVSYS